MLHQPNALVIGPMKAGTTWLHDYLEAQGKVCLPNGVKETFFFDRHYAKGLQWYDSHFRHYDATRHGRIMEVGSSYFHSVDAPQRVRELLGDIPLIVTLRDPVRRSWSHYLHLRRYGYTKAPLREAVNAFPEILGASRYAECLRRWECCFSHDSIYIFWQEDLAANAESYARRLCDTLNLPYEKFPETARGRSNETVMPVSPKMAAVARRTANVLRSTRLYSVINLAKRIGLKRLFFGVPGSAVPTLTDEDSQWLSSQLIEDYFELPAKKRHPNITMGCSASVDG